MTTDNTHDLESAIRALKDRPSMEAELAELRPEVKWLRLEVERPTAALRAAEWRIQAEFDKPQLMDLDSQDEALREARDIIRAALAKDKGSDGKA